MRRMRVGVVLTLALGAAACAAGAAPRDPQMAPEETKLVDRLAQLDAHDAPHGEAQLQEGAALMHQLIDRFPECSKLYMVLSDHCMAMRTRPADMLRFAEELAQSTPRPRLRHAILDEALTHLPQNQAKLGIEVARRALADPKLRHYRSNFEEQLSRLLAAAGEREEGIALTTTLLQAAEADYEERELRLRLGALRLSAGQLKEAREQGEAALELAKEDGGIGARALLARIHLKQAAAASGAARDAELKAARDEVSAGIAAPGKSAGTGKLFAILALLPMVDELAEAGDVEGARATVAALRKAFGDEQLGSLITNAAANLDWLGRAAPPLAGPSLEGPEFRLEQLKGKLVLVDFWATWCGPCCAELPNVVALSKEFAGKPFAIVSVSLDRPAQTAKLRAFTRENGMSWPQIYDGKGWDSTLCRAYNVHSIPATFLIAPDGKIVRAGLRGEKLRAVVQTELARLEKK